MDRNAENKPGSFNGTYDGEYPGINCKIFQLF